MILKVKARKTGRDQLLSFFMGFESSFRVLRSLLRPSILSPA
jgi:hypothetical protein